MRTPIFKIGRPTHLAKNERSTYCGRSLGNRSTLRTTDVTKCDCLVCLPSHAKALKAKAP